jgi:hypothetical protein
MTDKSAFKISDYFWPLGVGMLTGWVCLYLFLVYVLTHGGRIQGWHAGVWVLTTYLGTWIAFRGERTDDEDRSTKSIRHPASGLWHRIRISGALTCLALILPLTFSWVLGHYTDFSWDGMTSRGITVRNLMKGDSSLNAYPFGHVLAGFLSHVTGNWQAGKGINLTLIWICFCFIFPTLQLLSFSGWRLWFLSTVTALSPVAVYQISCFQIDGHVASLITCLLFSMLRILASGPIRLDGVLALVAAFVASASSKTSGVFYAIIIDGIFLLFLAGTSRSWKKVILLFGVALAVSWPLGVYIRSIGQYTPIDLQFLQSAMDIKTLGYGVGNGACHIEALKKMDRIQQFTSSAFAYSEIIPEKIHLKPPFWIQRRELRAFEELTPDPRAGGFGPLYSTALLLAGAGCLYLLFCGQRMYWPGWFLFLSTVVSSFGSQVWWARWTPQNWLIVIAFLMTILASPTEGKTFKGVRALAVLAAGLNVLLITLYYFVGMIKQEKILNRQIELASSLKNPVPIYISVMKEGHSAGASFLASEWWFVDRGTPVTKLEKEPIRPRMRIYKTATYIPLPSDWRLSLKSSKDEELFRKKGLIED